MKILNVLLITALLASGASAAGDVKALDKSAPKPETKAAAKTAEKADWKARVFTTEELKKYNGRDGMPVYVSVDGIVYDLSKVKPWKTGTHMKMHEAGEDQSYDIHNKAPKGIHHGGKILEKMPKVGVMAGYVPSGSPVVRGALKEEIGKETVCPVSGEKFKVGKDTLAASYKGRVYYFCCSGCDKSFSKDPEKYLKKKK